MSEDTAMQTDKDVRIRWGMFDVPTLIALAGVIIGGVAGYYDILNRLNQIEQSRTDRAVVSDRRFQNIENSISVLAAKTDRLPMVEQRTAALEVQLVETNKRLDRFAELLSTNIDLLRKDVTTLTVKVEVSSDKLDRLLNFQSPQRRTDLLENYNSNPMIR